MRHHHRAAALRMACGILGLTGGLSAQTTIDLRTQTKDVDFSLAVSTTPAKVGTVLPAICSVGQAFFKADAAAGANVYACTSTNTWTLETGGGGGGGGSPTAASVGQANYITPASGSGSAYGGSPALCSGSLVAGEVYWLKPDVTSTVAAPTLNVCSFGAKLIVHRDGSGLSIGELAAGVVYPVIYDGTKFELGYESVTAGPTNCLTSSRVSAQPLIDINSACLPQLPAANTWTGANDFTASPFVAIPTGSPSTSGASCTKGTVQYDTSFVYVCVATNTWKRTGIATW